MMEIKYCVNKCVDKMCIICGKLAKGHISWGITCGNAYSQNTTCKEMSFMRIILLQEDSMSGGCVFYVRRDVLSERKILFSM